MPDSIIKASNFFARSLLIEVAKELKDLADKSAEGEKLGILVACNFVIDYTDKFK